ncbi:hypothetical protein NDU88_011020 [Pleurodeles waltl]|uniref:Uncharacterized protein n=1 Tax=Pleurodeles waltl TaxID=8319 RepID=A0AAV7R1U9_PLEWA|nr:hypothetical protein NDU88_011020 [Pleurodeles waltl]
MRPSCQPCQAAPSAAGEKLRRGEGVTAPAVDAVRSSLSFFVQLFRGRGRILVNLIRLWSSDEDPAVGRLLVEGLSLGVPRASARVVSGMQCVAPFTVGDLCRLPAPGPWPQYSLVSLAAPLVGAPAGAGVEVGATASTPQLQPRLHTGLIAVLLRC